MGPVTDAATPQRAQPRPDPRPRTTAADEVVGLCSDLIRIDSTNFGDGSGPGERAVAEHVAALLAEVGLDPVVVETGERRTNVVARVAGADRDRPALLVHGHLDVVPANAADWTVAPVLRRVSRTAASGAAGPST